MVWINPKSKAITVLSIAGSDPSGGAGIAADLKTFSAIGVHGAFVLTALTAQNTKGIYDIYPIEPEFVRKQLKSVIDDLSVRAIKIGVIYSRENIRVLSDELSNLDKIPIVLDPVILSTTGYKLISSDEAITELIKRLIPITTLITPNKREAEKLTDIKIDSISDAKKAARKLSEYGPESVLIKGGHIEDSYSIDILYYKEDYYLYKLPRIKIGEVHGTGCSLSAAIAGYLALGNNIVDAVNRAKRLVYLGIKSALNVGEGIKIINPLSTLYRESERFRVLLDLWEAYRELKGMRGIVKLVPETRINFVYSLPEPGDHLDVAGFPGRITTDGEELLALSRPWFGASKHVANIVISANEFDPEIRAAINIKYSREVIRVAEKAGLSVGKFSRKKEPEKIKEREGKTLPWGVKQVIQDLGYVPDIIYDEGDIGKEPMVRILARNPREIVNKIKLILEKLET